MISIRGVHQLVSCHATVGEGPVFDPTTQTLYWVDIPAGRLWRHQEPTATTESRDLGFPVGSIVLIDHGGFLLAGKGGVFVLPKWSAQPRLWRPFDNDGPIMFNDGKCDSAGRFVVGTTSARGTLGGVLYLIDHGATARVLLTGLGMSNGLGWSPDGRHFYHVDSLAGVVLRYNWDGDTGAPQDPMPFVEIPRGHGLPDGLTVDDSGSVWLAIWGSGEVRRYDPYGRQTGTIRLPTPNVSSCTFGGRNGDLLYITTAADRTSDCRDRDTPAGNVFVANCGVAGSAPARFPRHVIPSDILSA